MQFYCADTQGVTAFPPKKESRPEILKDRLLEGKGADQTSSQQDKVTLENIDVDDMIFCR